MTCGELVDQYIALNGLERFDRIPQPRYIDVLSAYLAAWKKLRRRAV